MIHIVMMKITCLIVFMMEVIVARKILMMHGISFATYVNVLRGQQMGQMKGLLCHALVTELATILMDNVTL